MVNKDKNDIAIFIIWMNTYLFDSGKIYTRAFDFDKDCMLYTCKFENISGQGDEYYQITYLKRNLGINDSFKPVSYKVLDIKDLDFNLFGYKVLDIKDLEVL